MGSDKGEFTDWAADQRTADFHSRMAQKADGLFNRTEVAELLGVTPEAVDERHRRGHLLGVPVGDATCFPAAQFVHGAAVADLTPLLEAFGDMDPWGQLQLLVSPLSGFGGGELSILNLLRRGIDKGTLERLTALIRGWAA